MDLTVGVLRKAFGDRYETINRLIEGKSDDRFISEGALVDLNDYFVGVLWGKGDVRAQADLLDIELTDEQVDDITDSLKDSDLDDDINGNLIIFDTCETAIRDEIIRTLKESKKEV